MKKEIISSTIGMEACHENMHKSTLVKVLFYKVDNGVRLVPVSGRTLEVIKNIKQVTITSQEFNDRPYDYYNDQVEYFWALGVLGFTFSEDFE